MYYYNSGFCF